MPNITKKININLIKNTCCTFFMVIVIFTIIYHSQATAQGVKTGFEYCTEILVPSLFPIMFLSKFVVISNMLEFIKKPLNRVIKLIFYLPGSAAPVILLSLVGGYPVGASGVQTLLRTKEINHEQLNRMMCFCVNSGPAFTISVVGCSLLKNPFLGLVIFISQIIISITIGIITGIIARIKKVPYYCNSIGNKNSVCISDAIVDSISQTSETTISMCSLVTIFTVIISIFKSAGIFDFLYNICVSYQIKYQYIICSILSALEITSGCSYASNNSIPIAIISFAIAYGGLCTHIQIKSILRNTNFNYAKFHVARLVNAVFLMLLTNVLVNLFQTSQYAFLSTVSEYHASMSCSKIGSIVLMLLCLYLVISINVKCTEISKRKFK